MLELKGHLQDRIARTSQARRYSYQLYFVGPFQREQQIRYRHNIAHDGSISPLLGLLQIKGMVWPGMGSEVRCEFVNSVGF